MGNLVGGLFTGVSERQMKDGSGNGVSPFSVGVV